MAFFFFLSLLFPPFSFADRSPVASVFLISCIYREVFLLKTDDDGVPSIVPPKKGPLVPASFCLFVIVQKKIVSIIG